MSHNIIIPTNQHNQIGSQQKSHSAIPKKGLTKKEKTFKDVMDLGGSLKTNKKPLTNKQLHDLFAQGVADEYAESLK